MNKVIKGCALTCVLIAAAVCLAGCPNPEPEPEKLTWPDKKTALTFEMGDDFNEIKYSIVDTTPIADSYTLYYVEGEEYNVGAIQAGTAISVDITNKGKILSLDPQKTYSAVLLAKKSGYSDLASDPVAAQPLATAYLTTIKIINIPVGIADNSINENKELAFVWPQVVVGNGFSGFGVWKGEFAKGSGIKYEDNEIKPDGEVVDINTLYTGSFTTKLYATGGVMAFLLNANTTTDPAKKVAMPSPEVKVTGSGSIIAKYKCNDDQAAELDRMGQIEWKVGQFMDDPVKNYLELDWTKGIITKQPTPPKKI